MADKKIAELNLHTSLILSDIIPIVNNSETKKTTYGSLYYGIRDGVVSGSSQITIGDTTGFTEFSSSLSASIALGTNEQDLSNYALISGGNEFIGDQTISGSLFISGATELGGNIVPKASQDVSLGTLERPFKDIYIQSSSLHILSDIGEDTLISNVDNELVVSSGGMRLLGNASFVAVTGSFQYLSGSFTHIGAQFNEGDTVTTGSLSVSGSTIMIGNNTMTGNTELTGSVNISGSLNVNGQPVVLGQLSWARYDDTQYTTSSVFSLTTGAGEQTLPNNGGNTIETHLHSEVSFYNTGSQIIQVENEGDVYMCTVTFRARTSNATGTYLRMQLDSNSETPYERVGKDLFFPKGNNTWHEFHEVFQWYADDDFVANGNVWRVRAFEHNVDIANVIFFIQRTQNHLT